ncbi:Glucoamylase (glucan-1,4-alpha-glucosidase), GH15 family [Enhydrobacter aerosaccus]|uniref:Glucoamylase (Glucan-1,4-alpha-glucosidase), GH15 family n=1 Tax=Enhydrobacter aerosaccus TaxID=225324 RepID=A0A1T4NHB4_9HYPH|nr:glycoside hydrolase family 15 protein [Enhydrobacter aerosaccus]SJZ78650.1 Glucoamylase (glucan-1,4-alpha-glucosidase), GH15 family [Enhydrobacter aerosaccus]
MSTLDLGVVGNCAIASLIDRNGRHVWHGLGRLDGDPVFNALLGGVNPQGGFMEAAVAGAREPGRQRYLPNTAILETTIEGTSGTVRIVDFAPRFRRFGRMFRPPMLVRRLEPVAGRPRIAIRIRPTFSYGAHRPQLTSGSNHVRFFSEAAVMRLTTDAAVTYILHETEFALDRPLTLILAADESIPESPDSLYRTFLAETESYWHTWVRDLNIPFDWQAAVIRAAITLKLCSFEDTGAVLAALTTSVPEAAATPRNWDYRFSWLRDSFFTVTALNRLSATRTMERFVRFIVDIVEAGSSRGEADQIPPLFPIAPGTDTAERIVETLPGYRGYGPVRIGNAAVGQRQNDTYGSMVLTAAQMFWDERLPRYGDLELYRQLCVVGNEAHRAALTCDAGLWEYREREEVHTFSAAMCWAAQHRLGMIARRVGVDSESREWLAKAGVLRQEVLQRATTPDGWLSGVLDREMSDASSLVLPEIGLLRSDDPRFHGTLDMVAKRLMKNGFVMRYVEADDFGKPSNAFLLCTFWYIDALASVGRREEALELFNNVLGQRNHVGLLSEDLDPRTGELWGNFPQTYSQVGLILSAMRLSRSWEEGLWHAS